MSPHLALYFLGPPLLQLDGVPVVIARRTVVALLAYLAVNDLQFDGRRYSREFLSGMFWPEYGQMKAFANLRHALWEIHHSLGKGWVVANRDSVGMSPGAAISLDIFWFQNLLDHSRRQTGLHQRLALLSSAIDLYRDQFLLGLSLPEAVGFNEWVVQHAEHYRDGLSEALKMLVDGYCALNRAEAAIPHARRLVAFDQLDESAHRRLMQIYLQAGQHSAVVQQYKHCEQLLQSELGIDPQPETRALYEHVCRRETTPLFTA